MNDALRILFVGPDAAGFSKSAEALANDGHKVQCVASPFKALTAMAAAPADVVVIDASRLEDQMLESFEAVREVAPAALVLAAVTAAARTRAARVLQLGADAVITAPADPDEIRALVTKLRGQGPGAGDRATADDKLKWLGEFAGGVAHNINNPLTTVVGYLQILHSQTASSDQVSGVLSTMLRECDRISKIVKNLLLFSGNASVEPRAVDVNRAVDAALLLAAAEEQNDKVQVERSYEPGLPAVTADEDALKLACEQVAIYARRSMRSGGTLSIETARHNGSVVIRFRDTGPGIPPEKQARLFEPFYSANGTGGVGLGLSAAYGIIKSFGGTLRVESANGAGTEFLVELPARR